MNEGKKTLVFWAAAAVMLGIAGWISWPEPTIDTNNLAGNDLFEKFTDPQLAASMKIVTFDEEQGQLDTFEVRRDRESGLWNIPSRDGYPADAIDQMRNAANSLVGLKILDIQTENAEDHDDLGVAEPKLEDLEVGDEGVGRLVTFKSESQDTLASIIIGDQDKSDPEKRYVRIPGQDPVYVVKLDQSSLTTKFQDWIESDLLKLSSIDIAELEIQDYAASVGLGRQLSLTRNYSADIELEGTEWKLLTLNEFEPGNPLAEPTPVEVPEDQKLNKTKLDAMKNALDDLEIVNVVRKPDGMSASLRANKDFLDDREALASLQKNGFFPASAGPDGDVEILSANGELSVTLKDGVKYVMRFGNIAGVSEGKDDEQSDDAEGGEDSTGGGVNRYLLVTTMVDESRFPPPELQDVPKSIDELKVLLNPPKQESESDAPAGEEDKENSPAEESDANETTDEPGEESGDEPETSTEEEAKPDEQAAQESASEGEAESVGSGEASGSGEAQEGDDESDASDESTESESADDQSDKADATSAAAESEEGEAEDKPTEGDDGDTGKEGKELTEEELEERLEAEQEKITKANRRKLDARKDQIEAAEKKVRELNARFADWYYVIAEDTYAKLRIKRDDLFEKADGPVADAPVGATPDAGPQFKIPGGLPETN